MNKKYQLYALGNALVDTEIEVDDSDLTRHGVAKGVMTLVDTQRQAQLSAGLRDHLTLSRRACGGSAANTAIAVAQFGGRVFFSCNVGDDDNGQFYLDDLAASHVDHCGESGRDRGATGRCLVMITPDAERTMNSYLGVSDQLDDSNIDFAALADSEYLYIEGYLVTSPASRAAVATARQFARSRGVKIALSLSDPGIVAGFGDELREMVGDHIDLLFCNAAEALNWTAQSSLDAALAQLEGEVGSFAVTDGSAGAYLFDGYSRHHCAAQAVTAIDTNGAGDMFAGAYLYAIGAGHSAPQAGHFANVAASCVVSQYGPRLHSAEYAPLLEALAP